LHKDRRALIIAFDNGETFDVSAEYLRVKSPSAEVKGHSPDERKTVAGKKDVAILEVNPIGNYAVRLVFDDMHSTGIYSWDFARARPKPGSLLAGLSRRPRRQGFAALTRRRRSTDDGRPMTDDASLLSVLYRLSCVVCYCTITGVPDPHPAV